jgi:hypothetical protein
LIHCKRLLTSYPKLITDGNSDMHINEIEPKSGFAPFLSNSWILKTNLFVILRKAFIYFYCKMLQMKITSLYGAIQLVRMHRRGKGSSIRMHTKRYIWEGVEWSKNRFFCLHTNWTPPKRLQTLENRSHESKWQPFIAVQECEHLSQTSLIKMF